MNAASLLLRILAIAGAIAAGVFFYLDNGKLDQANTTLGSTKTSSQAAVDAANKNLLDAQTQLAAAVDAIKAANAKIKTLTDDSNLADSRVDGYKSQLQTLQDAADASARQLRDANSKISDLQPQVDSIPDLNKQVTDLQTQLTAANTLISQLQAAPSKSVAAGDKNNTTTATSTTDMVVTVPKNLSKPAPAKILLVDTKNWLMALNVGSDAGVQKDAELYLTVGDANLAVVKILDTSATQSSAAIISTEDIAPNKFSSIATKGLNVAYQTEAAQ